MIVAFELSMPNRGSWNGRWTGEARPHVKIVNFGRSKKGEEKANRIIEDGHFYYSFSDGWGASISAKKVDAKESTRLRRKSAGFCGYDWMVDEIRSHGRILPLSERETA